MPLVCTLLMFALRFQGPKEISRKKNPRLSNKGLIGRTPKGAYSPTGRSRYLLETPFSEPLLRTLLRTLFYCKTHSRPPSQNPSENPFPRTLSRTFSEPFLEGCVAVRPLRRAPSLSHVQLWCHSRGCLRLVVKFLKDPP